MVVGDGHGRCQPRIEVILNMQNKVGGFGRRGGGGGGGESRMGGCEPRIEVIVTMQTKKSGVGWLWGMATVDVNQELKLF